MKDFKIIEMVNGDVFVKVGREKSFLWWEWVAYNRQCWLTKFAGKLSVKGRYLRDNFHSVENAKSAIKNYLDSIEVEKVYKVEIKEE